LIQQDLERVDAEKLTDNLVEINNKMKKQLTDKEALQIVNAHSDPNPNGWFSRKMN
jgi:hypothetical protein